MKIMFKQQWKPRPLNSFLGFVDIKLGVTLALLFAVLNKVAGVYGIIAVLNGAGGSFAQLSMYIYSVLMLVALWWGIKAVSEEDPKHTLYFAHLFFADHVVSTAWTVFFAVVWWVYTPHDGQTQSNSPAQQQLIDVAGAGHNMTDAERAEAAMSIWKKEKGTALAIVIAGWCAKIYFAALLYSYASHLRRGSYRNLPRTNHAHSSDPNYIALNGTQYPEGVLSGDYDEEEMLADDFYKPTRTPGTGGSVTSFADFITAPGSRGRRSGGRDSRPGSATFRPADFGVAKPIPSRTMDDVDEVLFDSDEPSGSKFAGMSTTTEESASTSSRED